MPKSLREQILDAVNDNFMLGEEFKYTNVATFFPNHNEGTIGAHLLRISGDYRNGLQRVQSGVYRRTPPILVDPKETLTLYLVRTLSTGNKLMEDDRGNLFVLKPVIDL